MFYESFLSLVIYAHDHLLKPSGAILPDIANMYVAVVGKGELVYRFGKCIWLQHVLYW